MSTLSHTHDQFQPMVSECGYATVESHDFSAEQPRTIGNKKQQPQTQCNPDTEPESFLETGSLDEESPVKEKKFVFNPNVKSFVPSASDQPIEPEPTPAPAALVSRSAEASVCTTCGSDAGGAPVCARCIDAVFETTSPKAKVHNPYLPLTFSFSESHTHTKLSGKTTKPAIDYFPNVAVYHFDDEFAWEAIYATSPREFFELPTQDDGRHPFKFFKNKLCKNHEDKEMVGINLGQVSAVDKKHAVFAVGILGVITGVTIYDVLAQGTGTVRFYIRKIDLHRFERLTKRAGFKPEKEFLGTASPTYWLRSLCTGDVAVSCYKFLVDDVHPYHGGRDCPKHPHPKHPHGCPGNHSCCPAHTGDISYSYDGPQRTAQRKLAA